MQGMPWKSGTSRPDPIPKADECGTRQGMNSGADTRGWPAVGRSISMHNPSLSCRVGRLGAMWRAGDDQASASDQSQDENPARANPTVAFRHRRRANFSFERPQAVAWLGRLVRAARPRARAARGRVRQRPAGRRGSTRFELQKQKSPRPAQCARRGLCSHPCTAALLPPCLQSDEDN